MVRGRELPPVRLARPARRHGVGPPGGDRAARGRPAGRAPGPGPARAGDDRIAGSHVSRPEGFTVRRVAGAADVSRALGGRPGPPGRHRVRSLELAPRAVRVPGASGRDVRLLPPRGGRGIRRRTALARRPLLVGAAGNGPGAARRRAAVGARLHPAARAGAGDTPDAAPVRQPGVRPLRGRARASRPAPPHAPRGRPPLAGRSRDRVVRESGPVLVPLDAGAQRPAARRAIAAVGRRGLRGLRRPASDRWRMVVGPRPLRRSDAHPRRRSVSARRGRGGRRRSAAARAALAPRRPGGRGDAGRVDRRPARRPLRRTGGAIHRRHE